MTRNRKPRRGFKATTGKAEGAHNMNKIRSSSDERFNLEQQCLDFLETQGVEIFEHPGMDRLDSLVLQCLSMFDPSALDQDMTEGLAALRAKRDAASGVTGEWTRVEERREAR